MSQPSAPTSRRAFLSSLSSASTQQIKEQQTAVARAMRSPDNPTASDGFGRAVATPPIGVIALSRAGFGHAPGDLDAFDALGNTDEARLFAWIDQQLDPSTIDDSDCDARIANGVYVTQQKSLTQLWRQHWRAAEWADTVRPGYEVISLKFLRAMHSKRQLFEVLVDFWHDHFSIFWDSEPSWSMLMQYDRDCIRPNVLGNFRDMLGAVTKSPTMMYYLDQVFSSDDGPNENFARELLELHTLGSEHYFGSLDPTDVPGYPNPQGYVEEDVFAVTKALTGWTLSNRPWISQAEDTGEFLIRQEWHNTEAKVVLGQTVAANQDALTEGEFVLDVLAEHPGTATFVSRKLVRRLVADFPPESLVQSTAQVFLDNVAAPDQLKLVVRHILRSPEFRSTWGEKVKRPFGAAVSALRAAGCDHTFQTRQEDDSWTDTFNWLFRFTGHNPYEWKAPNGYPDFAPVWRSTSSLVMRWRVLNWLVDARDGDTELLPILAETHASGLRSPEAIVDYWIDKIFGYEISAETRNHLIEFMAQGRNPSYDLPFDWPIEWVDWSGNDQRRLWTRVAATVGLMFVSPEFQLK